jgi:Flp pilus assembly protein TadB
MARVQIVVKKVPAAHGEGPSPRRIGRLKAAGIIVCAAFFLIALLVAVFIVGSVIAAVVVVLLAVSILVFAFRLMFRSPGRS